MMGIADKRGFYCRYIANEPQYCDNGFRKAEESGR